MPDDAMESRTAGHLAEDVGLTDAQLAEHADAETTSGDDTIEHLADDTGIPAEEIADRDDAPSPTSTVFRPGS